MTLTLSTLSYTVCVRRAWLQRRRHWFSVSLTVEYSVCWLTFRSNRVYVHSSSSGTSSCRVRLAVLFVSQVFESWGVLSVAHSFCIVTRTILNDVLSWNFFRNTWDVELRILHLRAKSAASKDCDNEGQLGCVSESSHLVSCCYRACTTQYFKTVYMFVCETYTSVQWL